jgi:DNA-binding CsgD family transcriptional regulator
VTDVVEVLQPYSKQQSPEISAISVLDEARRDQVRGRDRQAPSGIRNTSRVRERVRVLSESEVQELVGCYRAGDSTYALSRRFSIRRETVCAHLERNGVMRRANRRIELDDAETRKVLALYADDYSVRRIAAELGRSERVVARTIACAHTHEAAISRRDGVSAPAPRDQTGNS